MFNLLKHHTPLWEQMQQLMQKERLPQALLFSGPRHADIPLFTNRLIATILCQQTNTPCGECRPCHLLTEAIHPDIHYIRPDTQGSAIKIDQIRALQETIYKTPQQGARSFVVIEPADKMNLAASNSLLKILEEPPAHTMFILLAEQLNSIPATILSRCQKYNVPSPELSASNKNVNYLDIGEFYPQNSPRAELLKQSSAMIAVLCELLEGKIAPCSVAAQWASYGFEDLIWFLHLITAQAIHYQHIERDASGAEKWIHFSRLLHSVNLFKQIDRLNDIVKKINHNINMNQTLTLETLLLGYLTTD
jgi:DNA polymerase III subunit delta'